MDTPTFMYIRDPTACTAELSQWISVFLSLTHLPASFTSVLCSRDDHNLLHSRAAGFMSVFCTVDCYNDHPPSCILEKEKEELSAFE